MGKPVVEVLKCRSAPLPPQRPPVKTLIQGRSANIGAAGVAYFVPQSPLPVITHGWVHIDGSSEKWRHGPANHDGPAVAILGIAAGQTTGLVIGTENEKVPESFVNSIAVNRFHGDGIVVHAVEGSGSNAYDVRVNDVFAGVDPGNGAPAGNDGDGIVIFGARPGGPNTFWMLRNSVIGSNGGNGVRLEARGANVQSSRIGLNRSGSACPNGAAGVLAGDAAFDIGLISDRIAFNHGSGVVSTPMARAINIASLIFANDGLGIDREAFSQFSVGFDQPSLFLNLREGSGVYLGPLPPMPAHRAPAEN